MKAFLMMVFYYNKSSIKFKTHTLCLVRKAQPFDFVSIEQVDEYFNRKALSVLKMIFLLMFDSLF